MAVVLAMTAAAGCWVVVLVKVRALVADGFRSLVLRNYTIAMAALAGVFTLLVPSVIGAIDRLSANLALLINSLLGLVCLTGAQTILVASAAWSRRSGSSVSRDEAARSARTVRRWWLACLAVDVLRAGLFIAAPARVHHVEMVDFAVNYARYPTLIAFNALRLIWFAVVFTNMFRVYGAYARQESNAPTRSGLWLHAGAGALGLVYVGYQTAYLLAWWAGHPLPGTERKIGVEMLVSVVLMLLTATIILYVGPILEARRAYRALEPLWAAVAAHRSGAVLDHRRFRYAERLIRRRQENIDGIARLRRYCDRDRWLDAYRVARSCGADAERARTIADAAMISDAVLAECEGREAPAAATTDALSGVRYHEVEWQVAVGRALHRSVTAGLALARR